VASILDTYLGQTCTVTTPGAVDATSVRRARASSSSATAACRFVKTQKQVQRADGSLITAAGELWLTSALTAEQTVTVDGTVYGSLPETVREWRDVSGTVIGYKALLGRGG